VLDNQRLMKSGFCKCLIFNDLQDAIFGGRYVIVKPSINFDTVLSQLIKILTLARRDVSHKASDVLFNKVKDLGRSLESLF
jgi:hypothetical protein